MVTRRRNRRTGGLRVRGEDRMSGIDTLDPITSVERFEDANQDETEFTRGLRTGVDAISAGSFASDRLDAELAGDREEERRAANAIQSIRNRGQAYAPRVRSLREITGLEDAGDYVAGTVGQGVASMAPSLAAALATRGLVKSPLAAFTSATAASYPQLRGEVVSEQYDDPILAATSAEDRARVARNASLAGAGLEAIVPTALSKTILRGGGNSIARNAITEGVTEAAQNEAQFQAARALDPVRARDPMDYADAFVAGALTGGGMTAGGQVIPAVAKRIPNRPATTPASADPASPTPGPAPEPSGPVDVSGARTPVEDEVFNYQPDDVVDEILAGDRDPSIVGATREETAANLDASAERRTVGTRRLLNELLEDDTIPDVVKQPLREPMDLSDPAVQTRIADSYRKNQALRALEDELPDPDTGGIDVSGEDRVKRSNLQEMQTSKMPQLVNTLARVLGPQADKAPQMARQLTALAARLNTGTLDASTIETITATRDALGGLDSTGVLQEVISRTLPDLAQGMEAIQGIPSAINDVRSSDGQSFMESMLLTKPPRGLRNAIARIVDENAAGFPNMDATRKQRVLQGLSDAFGSPERAQVVLDYYGELRRQAAEEAAASDQEGETAIETADETPDAEAEAQGITTVEQPDLNPAEYVFEKGDRPFRAFEGNELSNQRVQSTATAEAAKRRGTDMARTTPISMSQYVEETGGSPEVERQKITKRLNDSITKLEGRSKLSDMDRERLNRLKGERELLRKLYKEGGDLAVLDQYQVLKVEDAEPNDTVASDTDLAAMRTLLDRETKDNKERNAKIRETRITFEMADGTSMPLSAESMWRTAARNADRRDKESEAQRTRRLFKEAVSLVLNRPDVTGIKGVDTVDLGNGATETRIPRVRLRVDSDVWSRAEPNPEYRAQVRQGLKDAETSLTSLKTKLDDLVNEYRDYEDRLLDEDSPNYDKWETRRGEIVGSIDDAIGKLQAKLDDSMLESSRRREGFDNLSPAERTAEAKRRKEAASRNPLIGNVPAQAVARERLRLFKDARNAIGEFDQVESVLNADRDEPVSGAQDPDRGEVPGGSNPDLSAQGRDRYETGNSITDLNAEDKPTRKELETRIARVEKSLETVKDTTKRWALLDLHSELLVQLDATPEETTADPNAAGTPVGDSARERVAPGAMDVETGLDVLRATNYGRAVRTTDPYLIQIVGQKGYREIAPGVWAPPEDSGTELKPAMRLLSAKAQDALYNVAVEGNLDRLDTDEKKASFDAMSDVAKEQLRAIPQADRTEKQQQLLEALDRTSRQSSMSPRRGRPRNWSDAEKQEVIDEIRRIRGEDVAVAFNTFAQIGGSGEFSMNPDRTERLIRIAVNAGNMRSVAWHESLHDFFNTMSGTPEERRLKKMMLTVANKPVHRAKLRELLQGHPQALEQIDKSPEERLAYMFQFWAEGAMELDAPSTNVFERIANFIRELIGVVNEDQKVAMTMAALHDGSLTNINTVAEVMAERGQTLEEKIDQHLPFLRKSRDVVLGSVTDRLRDTGVPALEDIANMFHREAEFEEGGLPFLQRRFQKEGQWQNRLERIFDGTTAAQRKTALRNMQSMGEPSSPLETELAEFFRDIREYMIESGVENKNSNGEWVPMGRVRNYFPRVFDRNAIMQDREGFKELLMRDGVSASQADSIIKALTRGDGRLELAEDDHHLGFTPFASAVQNRQLTFINENNAADYVKYQSKDMADILTGYVKQAVHRAEYARDFGNDGRVLAQKLVDAKAQGATPEEIKAAERQIRALEGTLGHDMSPQMKEIMSTLMTAQNVILLPMAIFSQMVDSLGLAVRTGELKEAGAGYKRALLDLKKTITKEHDGDYDRELTTMLGIISKDNMLEAMGQTYGSMYMSQRARNINRQFFKYNGMQGWNNSMRIAATVAGERYMLQHAADKRRMKELGVKPGDILPNAEGRLAVFPEQFMDHGMSRKKAEEASARMQEALFKFVDGAVLRPNAAQRAVWMSDPRFMLVAHLKQFAFSFQSVILRRAEYEALNDNHKPMLMLGMYVPVMFAADMAKWTLTGSVPENWSFYDHFSHAVQRSGLLGKGEFIEEAIADARRGNVPGQSFILGPTGEHAAKLMQFAAGDPRVDAGDVAARTIPGWRYFDE